MISNLSEAKGWLLWNSRKSFENSRSVSKTQPQKVSLPYSSKLNFAESNHLNPPVGRDLA